MSLALHRYFLRSPVIGTLLLILLAVGIERLIVTDREAIEDVGEALARTAGAEQWGPFEALLHPDFEYGGRGKSEAIARVRGLIRKYQPISLEVSLYGIEIEGDRATAAGKVTAVVYGRLQQVRIETVFERGEDGAWRLRSLDGSSPAIK